MMEILDYFFGPFVSFVSSIRFFVCLHKHIVCDAVMPSMIVITYFVVFYIAVLNLDYDL